MFGFNITLRYSTLFPDTIKIEQAQQQASQD